MFTTWKIIIIVVYIELLNKKKKKPGQNSLNNILFNWK